MLDEPLDVAQEAVFVHAHQRDRLAGRARAAGAADAVHVVLGHVGQLEIDHVRQLVDVDAACGDVGGHQHREVAGLELGQRLGARGLALVAVDGHRADALLFKKLDQLVGAALHAGEHQHLVPVVGLDQVREQVLLHLAAHRVDLLNDAVVGLVATRHLDQRRLVEQAVGQRLDLVAEGRRKQQALLLRRHDGQHLLDVVDETHVEHAVGFVEHEDLDVAQIQRALLVVVEQAARCGHQDVDALAQAVDLRLHAHAAEHHHAGELAVLAVGANAFFDLGGELAGGGEDERTDRQPTLGVTHGGLFHQTVQHGQREAGRLAGAGLGAAEQVAAAEHDRNRLGLNGRGGGVAVFGDGTQQWLGQAEIRKIHVGVEPSGLRQRGCGSRPAVARKGHTSRKARGVQGVGIDRATMTGSEALGRILRVATDLNPWTAPQTPG